MRSACSAGRGARSARARGCAREPALRARSALLARPALRASTRSLPKRPRRLRPGRRIERRLFRRSAEAGVGSCWRCGAASPAPRRPSPSSPSALNVVTPRADPNAFAAQLVAALSAQGSNVQVVALYNAQSGQVRLTTALRRRRCPTRTTSSGPSRASAAPKSLGVITIDARNDVTAAGRCPRAGSAPGTMLAISLEPLGGSPNAGADGPDRCRRQGDADLAAMSPTDPKAAPPPPSHLLCPNDTHHATPGPAGEGLGNHRRLPSCRSRCAARRTAIYDHEFHTGSAVRTIFLRRTIAAKLTAKSFRSCRLSQPERYRSPKEGSHTMKLALLRGVALAVASMSATGVRLCRRPDGRWRRRCMRTRTSSRTPSTRRTTRRWSPPSRPPASSRPSRAPARSPCSPRPTKPSRRCRPAPSTTC